MQAAVTTPQRKPRRHPRQQKPKDSHPPINSQHGADDQSSPNSTQIQTMSTLTQQFAALPRPPQANVNMVNSPKTPERPRSMYDSPSLQEAISRGPHSGNVSAVESSGRGRKKAQKSLDRQSVSHSKSNTNGTSQRKNSNKPQTPRRTSAAPSQAYAGPTFHASPAPSSLPMPKFFSKSVPEVNKAKGLTAMMESEVSEEPVSQESSEGSPMLEKAERTQNQIREESPLDIFFRADREEKARARLNNSRSPLTNGSSGENAFGAQDAIPSIPSPTLDHVRHHSRHPTGSSTNGLFFIELEDKRPDSANDQAGRPSPPTDLNRATSAPSDIMAESGRDEAANKRNADSLALKKLLMTPQSKRPVSATTKTPRSEGRKQRTPTKDSSGPFASSNTSTPEVRILSRKQPASLPQLQKQFGTPSNSSPRPRPPSSNLRQELSAPQTPVQGGLPELPATPTPSCNAGAGLPPNFQTQDNIIRDTTFSSLRPTTLSGVGSHSIEDMSDMSSMENELKRVLKLDILGSDGASGVRS